MSILIISCNVSKSRVKISKFLGRIKIPSKCHKFSRGRIEFQSEIKWSGSKVKIIAAGGRAWLAGSGYFSSSNASFAERRKAWAGLEGFSVDFDPSVNRIYRRSSISKVKGDSPCACSYVPRASTSLSWSMIAKVEFDFVHAAAIGVHACSLFFIHRFETWFSRLWLRCCETPSRIWHLFRIIRAELCTKVQVNRWFIRMSIEWTNNSWVTVLFFLIFLFFLFPFFFCNHVSLDGSDIFRKFITDGFHCT